MRKALLIAALMMTTSMGIAHAGDSWSFMVNGQRVKIERPRNCTSLSCVNIVAPGLNNSSSDEASEHDDVEHAGADHPAGHHCPGSAAGAADACATAAGSAADCDRSGDDRPGHGAGCGHSAAARSDHLDRQRHDTPRADRQPS